MSGASTLNRHRSAKIVVSGAFGVGKTTFVETISEITPLSTEAEMTTSSFGTDDRTFLMGKTTTVALDFGRITIDEPLRLYLFGTPGQERFGFMWDDLVKGSLAAVVVVDTRRLEDCYPAVDYYEQLSIPFVVALNQFDGGLVHSLEDVRSALNVVANTLILRFDARDKASVKAVLLSLLKTLVLVPH